MSSFSGRDRLVAFDLSFLGDKSQFTSSMEGEWLLDGCPTTKTYILDMFSMARVQTEMP